ncbi:hypothetical protein L7F22_000552 [Adiantum nelumboides]|nr:hypothetical protein [Adiantum nelumboides]
MGLADADASSELCRAWGQVRDQQSLVFFDPGARANFITPQLAEKMGIKTDEMGRAYTASMAAPGHEVVVTPLIGKLRLHIQGVVHEDFYIMPLEGCDVLLGMPWFYNHKAVLDSFNKKVTLEIKGRKIVLDVKLKGESVPLVSASAVPRVMKQHIFAYLIYVKKRDETESSNLTFADGFPNLFVSNAHSIRSQHVAFLASFSSPAVIFEQLSIIYALPRMFVSSFTLVLPFFPTGTFERMEDEGDIATAFTLARILSNIPISRGGPTSLVIYDIHALQERFYFGDSVLPCFESGIPLLKQRLHQLPDAAHVTIAFPDDGAWKRFYKQLQHFPTIICTKVREGDKRIVRLKEGEASGQHVVIVDDLVQSGGTLIECQKVLLAHGAAKVSAYTTHGVFPNRSWEKFLRKDNTNEGFSYFWITDSCPLTVKEVKGKAPFEILTLAGSIAATLHI